MFNRLATTIFLKEEVGMLSTGSSAKPGKEKLFSSYFQRGCNGYTHKRLATFIPSKIEEAIMARCLNG